MKILLSNDDGYDALGITNFAKTLAKNHLVVIFAPDKNKSAASSSLTIGRTLSPIMVTKNVYKINGTPSDCVHIALRGFFNFDFDLVVTGINFGANMGDDVIYSGTVAGAIEARHLGLPAMAFSLAVDIMTPLTTVDSYKHNFNSAIIIANKLINNIKHINLSKGTILNINIPDKSIDKIKGLQATRLGKRHQSGNINKCHNSDNSFYLGKNGLEDDNSIGTDFYAINNNFVSISPLHIDLTKYNEIDNIAEWVK